MATAVVKELSRAVGDVAVGVGQAVVGIGRHGSGVVIAKGVVATNAHNVHADEVQVTFGDGRTATGHISAVDVDGDLATVTVDTGDAPAITWADSTASIGDAVFAVSNPGGRGLRVTFGLVSSADRAFRGPRGRLIAGSVEHTAPLPKGSSGGPLVDADGRVVAVNTHRLGEGFYMAMPADADLRQRLDALTRGESPTRRQLGVAIAPAHVARRLRSAVGLAQRDGLLVRAVQEGAPAARADIRQGDLLVAAGDTALASADDLHNVLDAADDSITLTVVRGSEELTVAVAFGATAVADEGSA